MDWTVLQHTIIALTITVAAGRCGNITAGAAFGVALFIGREHAQTEYRWIEQFCGTRANMPWWAGFDPHAWNWGSLFDWLVPLIVCVAVVLIINGFKLIEEDLKYY